MFNEVTTKRLLKPSLRMPKLLAFLKALFVRGNELAIIFKTFRDTIDEKKKYNSQTLSLEAYLRLKFQNNSIVIFDLQNLIKNESTFFLNQNQEKPIIGFLSENGISSVYSYWLSETNDSSNNYDFEVRIPIALQSSEDEIRATLNTMKLASKRYLITWI